MGDHNVSGRGAGATDSRGHFHSDRSNASAKIAHEIELVVGPLKMATQLCPVHAPDRPWFLPTLCKTKYKSSHYF